MQTDTPGKEWLAGLELTDLDLLDLIVAMEMNYTRGDLGFWLPLFYFIETVSHVAPAGYKLTM